MPFPVRPTSRFLRELVDRDAWLRQNRSLAAADRWSDAAFAELAKLGDMPEARPICRESPLRGRILREAYFGAGRSHTHRLVFEFDGSTVIVHAVRSFAEDDLTPGDL